MSTGIIDDGGPAFPHANPRYDGNWDTRAQIDGMTLREWFAGQALIGLLANPKANEEWITNYAAKSAYNLADAMIAARSLKKGTT